MPQFATQISLHGSQQSVQYFSAARGPSKRGVYLGKESDDSELDDTKKNLSDLQVDYSLSCDEFVVVVVAFFDTIQRYLQPVRPLSDLPQLWRTLARSLKLGTGVNLTEAYETDVAATLSPFTRPWADPQPLFLNPCTEIGRPGPYLRHFLLEGERQAAAAKKFYDHGNTMEQEHFAAERQDADRVV